MSWLDDELEKKKKQFQSATGISVPNIDVVGTATNAIGINGLIKNPTGTIANATGLGGVLNDVSGTIKGAANRAAQLPKSPIQNLQESLLGQAKQFEADMPKYISEQTSAKGAGIAQETRQQQRMLRSQAAAGGQLGSGQAKIKFANLSAGAKYAYMSAKADIEAKIRGINEEVQQEAISKSNALAGLSLEDAQRQYDAELQSMQNRAASLRALGGVAGLGLGTYLAQPDASQRTVPNYNMNYSQLLQMPQLGQSTYQQQPTSYLGFGSTKG